jgi:hypothetical protein
MASARGNMYFPGCELRCSLHARRVGLAFSRLRGHDGYTFIATWAQVECVGRAWEQDLGAQTLRQTLLARGILYGIHVYRCDADQYCEASTGYQDQNKTGRAGQCRRRVFLMCLVCRQQRRDETFGHLGKPSWPFFIGIFYFQPERKVGWKSFPSRVECSQMIILPIRIKFIGQFKIAEKDARFLFAEAVLNSTRTFFCCWNFSVGIIKFTSFHYSLHHFCDFSLKMISNHKERNHLFLTHQRELS